jgi:hypothetical protein
MLGPQCETLESQSSGACWSAADHCEGDLAVGKERKGNNTTLCPLCRDLSNWEGGYILRCGQLVGAWHTRSILAHHRLI